MKIRNPNLAWRFVRHWLRISVYQRRKFQREMRALYERL